MSFTIIASLFITIGHDSPFLSFVILNGNFVASIIVWVSSRRMEVKKSETNQKFLYVLVSFDCQLFPFETRKQNGHCIIHSVYL